MKMISVKSLSCMGNTKIDVRIGDTSITPESEVILLGIILGKLLLVIYLKPVHVRKQQTRLIPSLDLPHNATKEITGYFLSHYSPEKPVFLMTGIFKRFTISTPHSLKRSCQGRHMLQLQVSTQNKGSWSFISLKSVSKVLSPRL